MGEKQVWFITGAGRGLGVDIAKAAVSAGHAVVATARNAESSPGHSVSTTTCWPSTSTSPTPPPPRPLSPPPSRGSADSTCWSTTPGSFQAGFFEEMTPEAFRSQIETTLFGPVNVTAPPCRICGLSDPDW